MGWIIGKGIGVPFRLGGSGLGSSYWATRTPSTLTLANTGYPEGIKLDWLNAGTGYDGTSIERSSDGVTYAEIDTVAFGVLTYQDLTAVFGSTYYYRVRCYKGTNYSPYSNAESLEVTSDRFIITVDTTKVGSANDTFVLPTNGAGYDALVDWGEGGAEENITGTPGNVTHVYAASGTYQIKIRGTFPQIYFNNGGDKAKVIYLDNLMPSITLWQDSFYGCLNMEGRFKNISDLNILSCSYMFHSCMKFNSKLDDIKLSAPSAANFLNNAFLYNFPFVGWDTSAINVFTSMFRNMSALKQSFAPLSIQSMTSAIAMASGTDINSLGTTTNYDDTLISWVAQAVTYSRTGINVSFGNAKYGAGLVDSGTTDGVSAGKLIQSGQNFNTTVTVGDVVYNTTDGTYAFVTGIDSDTQLSISVDIMASGEVYRIQHSNAAKARAQLVIPTANGGQGWTITDGGYA